MAEAHLEQQVIPRREPIPRGEEIRRVVGRAGSANCICVVAVLDPAGESGRAGSGSGTTAVGKVWGGVAYIRLRRRHMLTTA